MRLLLISILLVVGCTINAQTQSSFPMGPDAQLTPGALCAVPNEVRYPEHISYCNRAVNTKVKYQIIAVYDQQLGYKIGQMNRQDFKIDHYIPLCVGGSNEIQNLWPQNKAVFSITDPMEAKVCAEMALGKLTQTNAIQMIRAGKADLTQVPKIMQYLNSL